MAQIVGGCLCGQVRYTANADPAFTGVCHCTACQKESGTAFNVVVAVPQAALAIQGSPKTYTKKGDSGKEIVSKFCPNCGSTILSEAETCLPQLSLVRSGTPPSSSGPSRKCNFIAPARGGGWRASKVSP